MVQLIASIWSLTNRWDDDFGYALESLSANRILYDKFRQLASDPPATIADAKTQFQLLNTENSARSSLDEKQGVTEDEKRMGMRAALRQLQKQCTACGQVPTSMTSTQCDVCGNFKPRRI
jgi:mobilome CxxCx(11)CxxC protein